MSICSVEGCEREADTYVCISGKKMPVCSECAKDLKDSGINDTNEILEDIHQRINKIEELVDKFGENSESQENKASKGPGFIKYGKK